METGRQLDQATSSASNVSYPQLPPLSPASIVSAQTTARRDARGVVRTNTQANIGRRRSTRLAALANTPPRASGSRQMSNVFVPSVPNIGERFASESSESSDNMKTAIPRDRHDSVHAIASSTAQESRVASSRESAISSDGDDEDPLGDLERAAALESSLSTRKSASPPGNGPATGRLRDIPSTTNFPEQLHVSPPQTPAAKTEKSSSIGDNLDPEVTNPVKRCSRQSTCSTSSEEWTGDEEFLPLSVRQRHRAQRLAYRQAPESPQQASRSNAQTRAGLHRDTATPLQQSFSYENSHKASRFRTQVRVRVVGETGTLQDRKESQADKDLDDEGEKMV